MMDIVIVENSYSKGSNHGNSWNFWVHIWFMSLQEMKESLRGLHQFLTKAYAHLDAVTDDEYEVVTGFHDRRRDDFVSQRERNSS